MKVYKDPLLKNVEILLVTGILARETSFNITTQGFERLATSQLLSAASCDARGCRVTAEAKSGANVSLGVGRESDNGLGG